jgi:hypothetical protein
MKRFTRDRAGVWTCLRSATVGIVTMPSGARVVQGWPYDGVDFAQLLEDEYANQQRFS